MINKQRLQMHQAHIILLQQITQTRTKLVFGKKKPSYKTCRANTCVIYHKIKNANFGKWIVRRVLIKRIVFSIVFKNCFRLIASDSLHFYVELSAFSLIYIPMFFVYMCLQFLYDYTTCSTDCYGLLYYRVASARKQYK